MVEGRQGEGKVGRTWYGWLWWAPRGNYVWKVPQFPFLDASKQGSGREEDSWALHDSPCSTAQHAEAPKENKWAPRHTHLVSQDPKPPEKTNYRRGVEWQLRNPLVTIWHIQSSGRGAYWPSNGTPGVTGALTTQALGNRDRIPRGSTLYNWENCQKNPKKQKLITALFAGGILKSDRRKVTRQPPRWQHFRT